MKLDFSKEEKQFIRLVLQDASSAARKGKDRPTYREGKKLIGLFADNSTYVDLKWKEFAVVKSLVEESVPVLQNLLDKGKNIDIVSTNLEFVKEFLPRLEALSTKWE